MASNVALMAPGTRIGAASPVGGGGEDIEGTLGEKVLNDAIASIRSIAETRGRNVEWAIGTVRDAKSSPASEAVAVGAVDGIAATFDEVLAFADGRVVTVAGGDEVTLELTNAVRSDLPMNPLQGFLHLLSDPNIAFILFTVGFYGLIYELMNPNFATGILGGIAIILAFIGLGQPAAERRGRPVDRPRRAADLPRGDRRQPRAARGRGRDLLPARGRDLLHDPAPACLRCR